MSQPAVDADVIARGPDCSVSVIRRLMDCTGAQNNPRYKPAKFMV